ncbi:hypothetical protein BD410DRAFT_833934 [Rickenella mellea]|uniref:Hepatocellular carcinoma-associated antigen 59-domain-containing protein n=1 Tax=Rickenella mellea TaxID=50990 RepID=A0A4R5XF24_9AGAM|nr:hypothetical protein BD410DRAFT_833934 [Rickenella mellea]
MSTMIKKRSRPTPRIRATSLEADEPEVEVPVQDANIPLEDLIEYRRFRRSRQGIDVEKLNKGDVRKKKKRPREGNDADVVGGLTNPGKRAVVEDEVDETVNEDAKARRVIRSNNFTQQTNALDVDKHMMAYIEENLKLRRGDQGETEVANDNKPYDPHEELFRLPDKYRIKPKEPAEEGNVTNSLAMLTAIPEVDLGMDSRLKNIEDTEKAKRAVADDKRQRDRPGYNDEEHLTAARFYKPNLRQKSDADILRDAKLEAMGLPPNDVEPRRSQNDRNQTATDDVVMERFKKRMRK